MPGSASRPYSSSLYFRHNLSKTNFSRGNIMYHPHQPDPTLEELLDKDQLDALECVVEFSGNWQLTHAAPDYDSKHSDDTFCTTLSSPDWDTILQELRNLPPDHRAALYACWNDLAYSDTEETYVTFFDSIFGDVPNGP